MCLVTVEWEVRLPLTGEPIAFVRAVHLGRRRELYFRAVTANPDPSQRKLIGYWGTPDAAHEGTLAIYEQASGRSLSGGGKPATRELVPQKPPPAV